ncbi:hypothetical protein EYZ11_001060 [Aspergillus tanneri]|uniref:Uncharacterized protein n=1 Tax=Aspergillus tanneri TaxID=1220188 RepID=A0A4S3JVF6_9EURO|nr:uncharacterized protein ATNIH1004_009699 [Aspergillus tanneri]KAA8642938.1 hypothetical protein ATNIH1004_009699 [Aspergillus tanneri]THC99422.1 hypothetical protein EYZ11_001060 [Aspergillus tanneri]
MTRRADYDDSIPLSDNAIQAGDTKVHGINPAKAELGRVHRTVELPDEGLNANHLCSGRGSSSPTQFGSGKGGHSPKALRENKVFAMPIGYEL